MFTSLKHAFIDSWENTTEEDRESTKKLPNFDKDVFEEVFGFQPFGDEKECSGQSESQCKTIIIDGIEYNLIRKD